MQSKPLLLLSLAGGTLAQSLADVLTAQSARLSTLNAWLTSQQTVYQILNNAQGVTLLAPSNDAFNALYSSPLANQLANDPNLLTAFLSYHVLAGVYPISNLTSAPAVSVPTYLNMAGYSNVTGGQVVQARSQNGNLTLTSGNNVHSNVQANDFTYAGGTLHIIDTALTIPDALSDTLIAGGLTAAVGALRRAAVEDTLNQNPDITVFAPNNDAFNAIGSLVDGMTLGQLTTVLNYHVIYGSVRYSQLMTGGGSAATAQGGKVNFRAMNGALFVNGARVVVADVLIGNGVLHVLDGVLNPANTTATPDPNAATQAPAFTGASSTIGGVPFTSAVITATNTAAGPTASDAPPVYDGAGPAKTAAVGVAALMGGAAVLMGL